LIEKLFILLIVFKFVHITSNYTLESESIVIVILVLYCKNILGRMIILLLATLRLVHLSSLAKIS